ncbi:MAG: adenosylcobinamide-GDP ribazoletransferase [Endomicrobia bacterium]|nr:adenosylcobinamide-GDP ribazoletransferase [Endomicrobiia bacterium]
MRSFFDTLAFLTILPIGSKTKCGYKNFPLFPMVGFIIGFFCNVLFYFIKSFFNPEITTLFVLSIYILFADHFHLDGFADTVDALASGAKKDLKFVLKDPTVGVMAVISLVILVMIKFFLLKSFKTIYEPFIIMTTNGRTSMAIVGFNSCPIFNESLGKNFLYKNNRIIFLTLLISFILNFIVIQNVLYVLYLTVLLILVSSLIKVYFTSKFGGVNGDIFGFCSEIIEVVTLIIIYFMWSK